VIMGTEHRPWQARGEVLSHFGKREEIPRKRYRRFILEGMGFGKRKDLTPEGGSKDAKTADGKRSRDSRILGCDSFVEEILLKTDRLERERLILKRKRVDLEGLMDFIANELGVTREEIKGGSRRRNISKARSAFCYVCLTQLGMTEKRLPDALQVSPAGIHLAFMRGEVFVNGNEKFQQPLAIYSS
jgi:hypothetical protein